MQYKYQRRVHKSAKHLRNSNEKYLTVSIRLVFSQTIPSQMFDSVLNTRKNSLLNAILLKRSKINIFCNTIMFRFFLNKKKNISLRLRTLTLKTNCGFGNLETSFFVQPVSDVQNGDNLRRWPDPSCQIGLTHFVNEQFHKRDNSYASLMFS